MRCTTKKMDNRELEYPISDKALEYYMKRAELIKDRLEKAGYDNLFAMSNEQLDEIPLELFAITKNEVMAALHEQAPAKWALPKTTLQTQTIEHTPPEKKITVSAGRGGMPQ